jgi:hypothetical protein
MDKQTKTNGEDKDSEIDEQKIAERQKDRHTNLL